MRSPAEIIASLTMQDGMIEDLDNGDALTIIDALGKEGYVIVPRIPTADMIEKAWADALAEDAAAVWRSMIQTLEDATTAP